MIAPLLDYANRVLAHSPDGLWMLDEVSGTTANDISSHARHGSYEAGYTLNQGGPGGSVSKSVHIDGDGSGLGRLEFPNSATASMTSNFTIGCLVSLDSVSTNGWNLFAVTTNDTSNNGWSQPMQISCGGNGSGGVGNCLHVRWGNGVGLETFVLEPLTNPSVNEWYHIALVVSGTTSTLYLDGASIGSASSGQARSNSGLPMRLGRRSSLSNQHGRTGEYAGLFVIPAALTQAQIQYILEPVPTSTESWSVGMIQW